MKVLTPCFLYHRIVVVLWLYVMFKRIVMVGSVLIMETGSSQRSLRSPLYILLFDKLPSGISMTFSILFSLWTIHGNQPPKTLNYMENFDVKNLPDGYCHRTKHSWINTKSV